MKQKCAPGPLLVPDSAMMKACPARSRGMGPGLTPVSTTRPVHGMQGRTSGSMKSQHWGPLVRVFIRCPKMGLA